MSRFTSAYHTNRPSAHQLAERQVLAVATNLNTAGSPYTDDPAFSAHAPSNSHPFGDSHDLSFSGLPSLAAFSDSPTRMPGRVATSVLGYNPFGRDGPRRRTSRWLVLVIPPSFITESQGAFGHTLSSGPSSRLSQGLLLPLYPTVNIPLLKPSECCVSDSLVSFQLKFLDVCAIDRDRAGIQFPEYCRDLSVHARQRSRCSVCTTDK